MSVISSVLFVLGFLGPVIVATWVTRSHLRVSAILIVVFGCAVVSWLCSIGADQAFYESIRQEYERTKDPDLLRRYTSDAGSGILLFLGIIPALLWSIFSFVPVGLIGRIIRFVKKEACRDSGAASSR